MAVHIEPEKGVDYALRNKTKRPIQHELDDLQDRTEAAAETANFLS